MCLHPERTLWFLGTREDPIFDLLFPEYTCDVSKVADEVCRTFDYAMKKWKSLGEDWLELSTSLERQRLSYEDLLKFKPAQKSKKAKLEATPPTSKRLLVLAFDDAAPLLAHKTSDQPTCLVLLQRALRDAHRRIHDKYGRHCGIFGVFADSNPAVAGTPTPATIMQSDQSGMLFSPFVLTQTMDVHLRHQSELLSDRDLVRWSQDAVLAENATLAWNALKQLGRPIWRNVNTSQQALVKLAAAMFANKVDLSTKASNPISPPLLGIGALLCRIGERPLASSSLAAELVAQGLATLTFVNCHHSQHFTTYSSDPILTFGAAQVWHRYEVLDKLMLPRLRQYIVEEMLGMKLGDKTCRSVATRVLLLLAMDMCGSEHLFTIDPYTEDYMRVYEGEFLPVMSFMNVLVGPNAGCIERVDTTETKHQAANSTTGFAEFEARWKTWLIGFSHFVSIESPTQLSVATLWLMLARRAAGIFQRDENRADLFIPIFTRGDGARSEARVSVLLVHVKSPDVREASDYPFEAESELDSRSVFVSSSDLHTSELGDILRVYLDLTTSATPRRFWFKEATACTSLGACLSGLTGGFGCISHAVIPILRSFVTPQAGGTGLVEYDVDERKKRQPAWLPQ